MTFIEVVILILVAAFVLLVEVLGISSCIGRIYDAKLKTRLELTVKLWDKEMEYIDKLFDKYMTRIENLILKSRE